MADDMVKVKMLRDRYGSGQKFAKDSIVELSPMLAKKWLARKIAMPIDGSATVETEVKSFVEIKADRKAELEAMTKAELQAEVEASEIEMPKKAKKADMVSALLEMAEDLE